MGKSTIAKSLGQHYGLAWMRTDTIRDFMRTLVPKESHAKLFNSDGYTAEQFLNKFSVEEIAQMELDQADDVRSGVKFFINARSDWPEGFVCEGVNIVPSWVAQDFASSTEVQTIFISNRDEQRIRNVVYNRGLFAPAKTYSDDVKEKEVEWVLRFDDLLRKEIQKYNLPLIELTYTDHDIDNILKFLL